MRYENYHKHTHYSNIKTQDSICKPEEYMKRAVELGHKNYFTTEHGFQGNIFEAFTLCQQYNLKCIYAIEAYYVDDIKDKSNRTNYHIMIVAMTESGRKQINKILSIANKEGFYYKPRIDLDCLLSLNPKDVIITTACIASRMFKSKIKQKQIGYDENKNPLYEEYEDKNSWFYDFFMPVYKHFGNNFYLEVQCHVDNVQAEYNKKILKIKEKYNVGLIHANDSHYIYPSDAKYRNLYVKTKGMFYDEEDNFILDYPDYDTIIERYEKQGILNEEQIAEALNNTLIFDKAEGIKLNKEFKIPNIDKKILSNELGNPDINLDDENNVLKYIISKAWKEEKKHIPKNEIKEYEKAIYYETDIIEKCGMSRYFIIDNIIVKRAIEKYNAVITRSGRGSAVSFYINHLLGLTEIDRIKSPITLYPTRFMSAERILSSKSLPDIDLNFADVEPVIKASKDILGEDGIYYMVAYKPLQDSSAFRLWCKANGYDIEEYNEIAKNLDNYLEDKKWGTIIEDSKIFRGVIESVAPSPCSFLLLDKNISEEIGLMRVGNSDNYVMCCALDGYNCDVYKYLKNDYLTVKIYEIIDKVYNLIGKPIDDIDTLISNCDDKVWDLYANGITTTINQADSDFGKQTVKRYKPTSLAELSAWVAAIRPGFASLLNTFLDRQSYSTGVKELDNILEDSFHFMMYQESIMKYLIWLGIEEKRTYDIIKKISKKKFKEDELLELQDKLKEGWLKNVGKEDGFLKTWQVVQDASHYSFNASHSLSVAIDSLYGAYLKSHYPLEYFTIVLTLYSGDMTRTANLIFELDYFNIKLENIKFGKSGSDYSMDKNTSTIYKGIASIKYCNESIAAELLELSKNHYDSFFDLLDDISKKTSVNNRQLCILTGLNFFSDYGKNKYLLNLITLYNGVKKKEGKSKSPKVILPPLRTCSQLKKEKFEVYEEYGLTEYLVKKYSGKETAKQYGDIDNLGLLNELASRLDNKSMSVIEQCKFEKEYLEYIIYTNPDIADFYYIVADFVVHKNATKPYLTLRNLKTGEEIKTKIKQSKIYRSSPFGEFSILKIEGFTWDFKSKFIQGKWQKTDELEPILENYDVIKNVGDKSD